MQNAEGDNERNKGDSRSKKRPNESQKVRGTKTLGILKESRQKTHLEATRCLTKTPRWKCPSCKQLTCISLTLGDFKGQF